MPFILSERNPLRWSQCKGTEHRFLVAAEMPIATNARCECLSITKTQSSMDQEDKENSLLLESSSVFSGGNIPRIQRPAKSGPLKPAARSPGIRTQSPSVLQDRTNKPYSNQSAKSTHAPLSMSTSSNAFSSANSKNYVDSSSKTVGGTVDIGVDWMKKDFRDVENLPIHGADKGSNMYGMFMV